MQFDDENIDEYEGEVDFGEEADYKYDEEAEYDKAFEKEVPNLEVTEESEAVEYEYDEVVGARDKKPIMSKLNQRVLNKHEMDDLLNEI